MGEAVEVWSGGANTWESDEMGHLNVRFWVAKSLEALGGLARVLGMPEAFTAEAGATLVVREQHMRFLREARAGMSLTAQGSVVEMGEDHARLLIVLHHLSGEPAATFQTVVSHVTAGDLKPFPWPQRVRDAAAAITAPVPAHAAARSIDLSPVTTMASLAKAEALGLKRIGLGTIQTAELDVFGRMRGEMLVGRISDGVSRLFGNDRPGPALAPGEAPKRIGGAVLEYRIVHHDWPRAGDHIEVRSALSEVTPRIRRVMHWMVDPVSGKPWGSTEAVTISFDLDARKTVDINPEAVAQMMETSVPGLGL